MGDASSPRRELWTCPRCGHGFVTRDIWHSCTRIDLDAAFVRSAPAVRQAFDRYVDMVARCGPVTVIAQKSRIVIMGRVRFAGVQVRRDHLVASFALTRRLADPRFRIETLSERWNAHRFIVRGPADLDFDGLTDWLCESYRDLGIQSAPSKRRRSGGS